MSTALELVDKIIGENFYFEESMGIKLTDVTVNDILKINSDVIKALGELQLVFDEEIVIREEMIGNYIELMLVITSEGNIGITFTK